MAGADFEQRIGKGTPTQPIEVLNSWGDIFEKRLIGQLGNEVWVQGMRIGNMRRSGNEDFEVVVADGLSTDKPCAAVILFDRNTKQAFFSGELKPEEGQRLASLGIQGILAHFSP